MNGDQAHYPPVEPFGAGFRGRCPRCGEGQLFDGYISLKPRCTVCGLDYDFADSADGPAVFVMLIIGFIVVGLALWLEVSYGPPLWVHFLLWVPLVLILCLPTLRWLKGIMIALQYSNKAAEGRLDKPK
ncbi:DUF983 domain-containing protein [Mesorhizobium sp. J428]|uniref:DUF983 domain-containing protein n=1 Tax=Mesorhizobium sp. J428 TaxID=2898440 RepID=UPI002151F7F8|nr:DUF983 domain-containing protein [Mesorhizobium sp. J428]MCR5858739.1 DUF983 domain-containing protein [Mesorhizobium sp. J428]